MNQIIQNRLNDGQLSECNITLDELNALPPRILDSGRVNNGPFEFSGSGPRGANFRVLASGNLASPLSTWMTLTGGTFSGGVFDFIDEQATNHPQRFYTVVTP